LIESVATNVPRLDYTNATCPSILVEPQRTNLTQRSEDFSNGYWVKTNSDITSNSVIAPDGVLSADTFSDRALTSQTYVLSRNQSYTSGTAEASLVGTPAHTKKKVFNAENSKSGDVGGWSVERADDFSMPLLQASQTGATLVLPIELEVGQKVVGFYVVGQVESAAETVTLDCAFKKHTAAAADVVTTTIADMTQVSVTADTALTIVNTFTDVRDEVAGESDTYFFVFTGTTGTDTDIALQGVGVLLG